MVSQRRAETGTVVLIVTVTGNLSDGCEQLLWYQCKELTTARTPLGSDNLSPDM